MNAEDSTSKEGGLEQAHLPAHRTLAVRSIHVAEYDSDFLDSKDVMPNLRIVSLTSFQLRRRPVLPMQQVSEAYPHLTHLEVLEVGQDTFDPGLDLSSLTTLSLQPSPSMTIFYTRWGDPRIWNLPSLRYLSIKGIYYTSSIKAHIEPLLRTTGAQLRGLSIVRDIFRQSEPIGFKFSSDIWEWCPNLECLSGTALSLVNVPVPPPTVPVRTVFLDAIFGFDGRPIPADIKVRETPDIVATITKRWHNVECFQLQITWDRFLLKFVHEAGHFRAEWIDFLIPFGLFQEREAYPLRDADGIAFDDKRAYVMRQKIQVEAVKLAQKLPTTVWTNGSLAIRGLKGT